MKDRQLTWYNTSNALWMGSFSIQQLLVTWILVGVLHESPESVGFAQLLIGIPGLVFMLWGGVIGDRIDGRKLLVNVHYLSAIPPLLLAMASTAGLLTYWVLIVTALAASLLNSASNPARNTILNIVAKNRLQFAISLSTGIGSIATMAGTKAAGELDSIGLENVLYLQAALFVVGGFFAALLKPGETPVAQAGRQSMIANIRDGLVYVWRFRLARDIIGLNCLSSFFNAGAWMVAIPFIVKETYGGDAVMLANINVVFYFGSLIANFGLLRFMPLLRPGRLYLIMQVTRIAVLALIWIEPPLWVMWIAAAYWGFNMGVTTTMSRLMVQEIAEPEYRARTMSVFTLGLMSATPIGSLVLGFVIGSFGPLNALIPGMVASLLIFAAGVLGTSIWRYHSPEPA